MLSITLLGVRSTTHAQPKKYNQYHSYTVPILLTDRNKKENTPRQIPPPATILVIGLSYCLGSRETQKRGWEALNSQLFFRNQASEAYLT